MKTLVTIISLLLVASFSNAQTVEEQTLLDIEKKRSEAIAKHDDGFLDELYDDKFQGVTALGIKVDKQKLLDVFKLSNPEVVFTTEEMKAVVYDDAAIITGKLVSKSKEGGVLGQSRFMHIYIRRQNEWKIVAGQATVIK